ncbi:hypothetical protein TI04_01140 [Achromatium sp. WMS2]|nr:hypothetical protein TI04_01140 [Achromatium sp. WMS2]
MVKLIDVTRQYGQFTAIDGLNLTIDNGEVIALLGPNGAGKTTTLRMLMGHLCPSRGHAYIGGFDCFAQRYEVMKLVGYLPDEPVFYEYLSGGELLRFMGKMHGLPNVQLAKRIEYLVETFDFADAIDEYAVNYSRGMKKKLGLAIALLHEPKLLILDEPSSGLDPFATKILLELLSAQITHGTTILFSTHLMEQAERLCHRAAIIGNSRLLGVGTIAELRQQLATDGNLEQIFFAMAGKTIN